VSYTSVDAPLVRLVESASDELARLDALCAVAPAAVAEHLRLAALAQLVLRPEGTPFAQTSLAAAAVDSLHDASLPPEVDQWIRTADAEERRARSGAPLTAARVLTWFGSAPSVASAGAATLVALDDALRPGGTPRAVLLRAAAAAAIVRSQLAGLAATSSAAAELLPALMLCAAGNTDRIRLLPFAGLDTPAREDALAAWTAGDEVPFAQLALAECARAARAERQSVSAALAGIPAEDARLDALGRAAITARRALAALRQAVGVTMPALATTLDCSRPAAGDALDRLVELQLAHEITGRGRDRVFVWRAVHRPP
jgi:hypothetical protein